MALLIRTLAAAAVALPLAASANTGVTITSYGHSALLIQGGGAKVLVNPFKAVACASGLAEPRVSANVILASSLLLDEGAPVAKGKFLSQPGSYRLAGLKIEGISAPHDRFGGRRFGQATLWRWNQGGLSFAHLGGTAAQLSPEDRVLLGKPDVLIVGVGGGAKVYDGAEAAAVVRELAPKRVIPVQYVSGKTPANCDQSSVEPFLEAMKGTSVKRVGRVLSLPGKLGEGTQIDVMR
ncbi:MAG: MBL fold metallo-hydrolase [Cyanobacteria bacterium]|jgi:L-ascorbate metabolism protein UlaG (beta-lactamase superfamily)|uniref:MBL fold metallo-hydrolase n=1 Tax=unclassified Vulcanococcus TaxID=2766969 RepID=UPI0025F6AC25|nr:MULTISPECIES: MBL fold metallo-hydrolase [unclassified Vulcanococcus]MDA0964050.1 MBL fold metallo-hydrolase [Cyanobacteriota bacterium]NCV92614.1 Zn-dependent hydrolase [Synechococcaceae bacterium WB7_3xG_012]